MRASAYPMVDAAEAAALVLDRTPVLPSEVVPIAEAAGRVLAEDVLVQVGETPGPGQIVDSNRWALLGALREAGADVELLPVAPDELDALRALVEDALARCDVLVTSGGVSVGSHDLVKPLLERLGEVHVGRVRLKPGK